MAKKKVATTTQQQDDLEVSNMETDQPQPTGISGDETDKSEIYDPSHPGWTQYVLEQLTDDEKFNDLPKADGLRRLVETLIGPIVKFDTKMEEVPRHGTDTSKNTATAVVQITYLNNRLLRNGSPTPMSVTATGDANDLSCDFPFNKYLSSMAETRAKGRAYREILRLKNTCTSEEISGSDVVPAPKKISDATIVAIDMWAQRANVGVHEVFKKVFEKDQKQELKPSIRKYDTDETQDVLERLQKLHKKLEKDKDAGKSVSPPKELGTYDSSWREYFG